MSTLDLEGTNWLEQFGPDLPPETEEWAELERLSKEVNEAWRLQRDLTLSGMGDGAAEKHTRWFRAYLQMQSAQNGMCKRFARERGWTVSAPFNWAELRGRRTLRDRLRALAPRVCRRTGALGFDCFRDLSGAPIAIVQHGYILLRKCERFARVNGFKMELLPASWWHPGVARAVLYTRA